MVRSCGHNTLFPRALRPGFCERIRTKPTDMSALEMIDDSSSQPTLATIMIAQVRANYKWVHEQTPSCSHGFSRSSFPPQTIDDSTYTYTPRKRGAPLLASPSGYPISIPRSLVMCIYGEYMILTLPMDHDAHSALKFSICRQKLSRQSMSKLSRRHVLAIVQDCLHSPNPSSRTKLSTNTCQ